MEIPHFGSKKFDFRVFFNQAGEQIDRAGACHGKSQMTPMQQSRGGHRKEGFARRVGWAAAQLVADAGYQLTNSAGWDGGLLSVRFRT